MARWEGLYAIVDVPHPAGLDPVDVTRAVLAERLAGGLDGAAAVQLRAKGAQTPDRVGWARGMSELCAAAAVPFVVNDDIAAALEVGAVLHLGQDDPGAFEVAALRREHPGLQVGLSTHDLSQLREALRQEPDYVAFGPVARTESKADPDPIVGLDGLTDAGRVSGKPLVAIGGLNQDRAAKVVAHGAAMAAVIGALQHDTLEATRLAAIELSRALRDAARMLTLDEVAALIPVIDRDTLAELPRWGDSLSVHLALELPARFAPRFVDGKPAYRYCEVLDLLYAMGKRPHESWDQWQSRGHGDETVVQLRRG